jgi:N-glycosylase/DNA lyase
MKTTAIVPVLKSLPPVQIVELAGVVLNHFSTMKSIEADYRLAKKEMRYRYKVEMQNLHLDMERFITMARLQKKQFEAGHRERMKMLTTVELLSREIAKSRDPQMSRILGGILSQLLEKFGENQSIYVGHHTNNAQIALRGEG